MRDYTELLVRSTTLRLPVRRCMATSKPQCLC